ncbi:hypothetical protein CYMTET_26562 [Cymbomonas tetramitiformis]|uniref:Uncharacterized protein n=1 Tax=Cymbomonas tetramitiformis TaxID=36881 RepID=A0AAE0FS24_9CHLO|nr:hypothetical protein CYMTET_26562 [Cymbomonas tetramitiformis]
MASVPFVAIVTGANKGIGLECVRRLCASANPSAKVVLTSRNVDLGKAAVSELEKDASLKVLPIFHELDITKVQSINAFSTWVSQELGGVDALINNAGFSYKMTATEPFEIQARNTIDINYYGTKKVCQTLLPLMRERGRIVNISSSAGENALSSMSVDTKARFLACNNTEMLDTILEEFVSAAEAGDHKEKGFAGSAYGMSKAGVTQLTRILSVEASNIMVVSCCPGLCRTDMAVRKDWSPVSIIFWLATFLVGHSAHGGADTPVWLAHDLSWEERSSFNGKFVRERVVRS